MVIDVSSSDYVIEIKELSFWYWHGGSEAAAKDSAGDNAGDNAEKRVEVRGKSLPLVLDGVSVGIPRGKVTTVLGANGSGKSTLFHLIGKNLPVKKGEIRFEGEDIKGVRIKDYAKRVSIVHQANPTFGDVTVESLVSYGRTPFLSFFERIGANDQKLIERAMKIADVTKFRDRKLASLSGGQRQRAWIAMALAQDTDTILLDEPTTWLDIRYQIQILRLIRRLNQEFGTTVVMVLHDMNQAIQYSDEIIGLKDGKICGHGRPEEIVTEDFIEDVYGIRLKTAAYGGSKFVIQV
jgi:iron complex transport system ATP-binding protein